MSELISRNSQQSLGMIPQECFGWSTFTPIFRFYIPENRQPKIFWHFQGVYKWNSGLKRINECKKINILKIFHFFKRSALCLGVWFQFWLFITHFQRFIFAKKWYANLISENWNCIWYGTVLWSHLCKFSFFSEIKMYWCNSSNLQKFHLLLLLPFPFLSCTPTYETMYSKKDQVKFAEGSL